MGRMGITHFSIINSHPQVSVTAVADTSGMVLNILKKYVSGLSVYKDYEKMLDKAYKSLPKKKDSGERFKVPEVLTQLQGNRTIFRNFDRLIKDLKREPKHAFKYISGEIGTACSIDNDTLVLSGKFSREAIQKIFNEYVSKYVLCSECQKPDTKVIDQKGIKMLKCEACGALTAIRE